MPLLQAARTRGHPPRGSGAEPEAQRSAARHSTPVFLGASPGQRSVTPCLVTLRSTVWFSGPELLSEFFLKLLVIGKKLLASRLRWEGD